MSATAGDLRDQAVQHLKRTTISYPEWAERCRDPHYNRAASQWQQALAALAQIGAQPPPPPPPKQASPFAGVGIFASEQPLSCAGLAVDWVAATACYLTPQIVAGLKQAGKRVFAWDELGGPPVQGVGALARLGADGYVWTVETEAQLEATPTDAPEPRAIICNTEADPFPAGWHCIAEAYTLLNPLATADQMVRDMRARGASEISVCVLPADGGKRVPLSSFDPMVELALAEGAIGVSVFRAETLGPGDAEHLRELAAMVGSAG